MNFEPDLRAVLKRGGFLTRDSRVVERKKYGKAKARRSFQFSSGKADAARVGRRRDPRRCWQGCGAYSLRKSFIVFAAFTSNRVFRAQVHGAACVHYASLSLRATAIRDSLIR